MYDAVTTLGQHWVVEWGENGEEKRRLGPFPTLRSAEECAERRNSGEEADE